MSSRSRIIRDSGAIIFSSPQAALSKSVIVSSG
jgi:hypothetical protein